MHCTTENTDTKSLREIILISHKKMVNKNHLCFHFSIYPFDNVFVEIKLLLYILYVEMNNHI